MADPSMMRPLAAVRAQVGKLASRGHTTLSLVGRATGGALSALYGGSTRWLDRRFFAWTVAYATHPFVIVATMLLLVPLILDASNTALALTLGNYTNVCSAAVSSIVLMQSLKHHRENKQMHAAHTAAIETQTMAHRAALKALQRQVDTLNAQLVVAPSPPQRSQEPSQPSQPTSAPAPAPAPARTTPGRRASKKAEGA